jgi:hypothetical protein
MWKPYASNVVDFLPDLLSLVAKFRGFGQVVWVNQNNVAVSMRLGHLPTPLPSPLFRFLPLHVPMILQISVSLSENVKPS